MSVNSCGNAAITTNSTIKSGEIQNIGLRLSSIQALAHSDRPLTAATVARTGDLAGNRTFDTSRNFRDGISHW